MARVTQSSSGVLGFRTRSPSHFPATFLKSVTAVGCHWRVSFGAIELQAMTRGKKAKPINPTIFFIYILFMTLQVPCRPAHKDNFPIRFFQFEFGLISANSENDCQSS